jgi:hypothetical protein
MQGELLSMWPDWRGRLADVAEEVQQAERVYAVLRVALA